MRCQSSKNKHQGDQWGLIRGVETPGKQGTAKTNQGQWDKGSSLLCLKHIRDK